jgi:hypothetical protein
VSCCIQFFLNDDDDDDDDDGDGYDDDYDGDGDGDECDNGCDYGYLNGSNSEAC